MPEAPVPLPGGITLGFASALCLQGLGPVLKEEGERLQTGGKVLGAAGETGRPEVFRAPEKHFLLPNNADTLVTSETKVTPQTWKGAKGKSSLPPKHLRLPEE